MVLRRFINRLWGVSDVVERVTLLSRSVALADNLLALLTRDPDSPFDSVLITKTERLHMRGTVEEIRAAARRLAGTTKSCVTITVVVGHHHHRACAQEVRN